MTWGLGALGLGITQVADEHLVNPMAVRFGAPSTGFIGEIVDAGTTLLTALGGGYAVKMIGVPAEFVDPAVYGGGILGLGKLGASFIPGASVAPTLPIHLDNLLPKPKMAVAAIAGPTRSGGVSAASSTTALGNAGTVSNPSRPVVDSLNGGL